MTISASIPTAARLLMQRDWLTYSTIIWFFVTALGQWLFVIYIFGYYGLRFFQAGVDGFEGTRLANGFIQGDDVGNTMVAIHVLIAALIVAAGQIQLVPAIRRHYPKVHRCSGWFYMLASVVVSVAGAYLVWSRERVIGSLIQDIGVTVGGILTLLFVPIALYYAIKRNFIQHRRWALRLFMVVSAVWFLRLMIFGWFITTGGMGIDMKNFSGPFPSFVSFAQYLLPLLILELYFWAKDQNNKSIQFPVALLICFTSLSMAVGIVGVLLNSWLPHIGK